jgi:hypothetical protein
VDGAAVSGLVEKLNAGATIRAVVRENDQVHISVRSPGMLGMWLDRPPSGIEQNGRSLAPATQGNWITIPVKEAGDVIVHMH